MPTKKFLVPGTRVRVYTPDKPAFHGCLGVIEAVTVVCGMPGYHVALDRGELLSVATDAVEEVFGDGLGREELYLLDIESDPPELAGPFATDRDRVVEVAQVAIEAEMKFAQALESYFRLSVSPQGRPVLAPFTVAELEAVELPPDEEAASELEAAAEDATEDDPEAGELTDAPDEDADDAEDAGEPAAAG